LFITVNKKQICNVAFINVISKVISIVMNGMAKEMEIHTERCNMRQRDKETKRQREVEAERQRKTERQRDKETELKIRRDKEMQRERDKETEIKIWRDRDMKRKGDEYADKQRGRKIKKEKDR
jgi:hypothetical protein